MAQQQVTIDQMVRDAGYATLPPGGAWVSIKGCPWWPKGQRIIKAHRELGVQHMDIRWANKEVLALGTPRVNRYRRRNMTLLEALYYDMSKGIPYDQAYAHTVQELRAYIGNTHQGTWQATLITVSHPGTEEMRFFNSEVAVMDTTIMLDLLQENLLDVIVYGKTQIPALEGIVAELADALMLDGLSHAQAYQEIMTAGFTDTPLVPQWFYRPKGWYRDMFCEESE